MSRDSASDQWRGRLRPGGVHVILLRYRLHVGRIVVPIYGKNCTKWIFSPGLRANVVTWRRDERAGPVGGRVGWSADLTGLRRYINWRARE